MKKSIFLFTMLFGLFSNAVAQKSWNGYEMQEFTFKNKIAKIVIPKAPNKNRNWIWRARFWGHEPQVDLALLARGFHLVYVDVADLYGNAEAVKLWNLFYKHITQKYELNEKVVLEGFSRGGLIVYNWTVANINKVACIYADAPVCDIKSWPGGLGKGNGSTNDWKKCLKAYQLTTKSVNNYEGLPIYQAKNIAEAQIPIIHVCGAADQIVPIAENTLLLKTNLEKYGSTMELILKEGIGHHPHSLKNPTPIVDFILKHIK
ncbi:MAG: prolyl oligopeptidase family serine peptidase [Bacteroidota bacterium]